MIHDDIGDDWNNTQSEDDQNSNPIPIDPLNFRTTTMNDNDSIRALGSQAVDGLRQLLNAQALCTAFPPEPPAGNTSSIPTVLLGFLG